MGRAKKKDRKPPEKCRDCGSDALMKLGRKFVPGNKGYNWYELYKCVACGSKFKFWLGVKKNDGKQKTKNN